MSLIILFLRKVHVVRHLYVRRSGLHGNGEEGILRMVCEEHRTCSPGRLLLGSCRSSGSAGHLEEHDSFQLLKAESIIFTPHVQREVFALWQIHTSLLVEKPYQILSEKVFCEDFSLLRGRLWAWAWPEFHVQSTAFSDLRFNKSTWRLKDQKAESSWFLPNPKVSGP